MTKKILITIISLWSKQIIGQNVLTGHVLEISDSKELTLPGANVYFIPGLEGVITDATGYFSLNISDSLPASLVISFPGFTNDTLIIKSSSPVKVFLKKSIDLKAVDVSARKEDIGISTINPMNSEKITQRELLKAACCNLSEAFETNPSVNVAYKDAVTVLKKFSCLD